MPKGSGKQRKKPVPKDLKKLDNYEVREVPVEEFTPEFFTRIKEKDPALASFLDLYDAKEMRKHNAHAYEIYVDGQPIGAGFAIADRDVPGAKELFSVSKDPDCKFKGLGKVIAREAVARGATNLFAFDTETLRDAYESAGFEVYERWAWNQEYAPRRTDYRGTPWSYQRFGRPHVIFMALPGKGSRNTDWEGYEHVKKAP